MGNDSLDTATQKNQGDIQHSLEKIARFAPLVTREIRKLFQDGIEAEKKYEELKDLGIPDQVYAELEINATKSRLIFFLANKAIDLNYLHLNDSFRELLLNVIVKFGVRLATLIYAEFKDKLDNTKNPIKKNSINKLLDEIENKFPSVINDFNSESFYRESLINQQSASIAEVIRSIGLNL